jgi:hypothetical protein
MNRLLFLKCRNFNFACLFRKIVRELNDLNCANFAAPEDVRILTYPDIPDYRLENALLGKTLRVYRVPSFLSCRLNWVPPPPHPQASVWVQGGRHTRFRGIGRDDPVLRRDRHWNIPNARFSGLRIYVLFLDESG